MSALNCYDCHELEQELKIAYVMNESEYQRGRKDAVDAIKKALLANYDISLALEAGLEIDE